MTTENQTMLGAQTEEVAGSEPQQTAGDSGQAAATSWRDTLPEELKNDTTLLKYNDVSELAKAYKHAQKLIGANKIPVPDKHATADDWKEIFKKLGNPDKLEDYKVSVKEDAGLDNDFMDWYRQAAHSLGILPHQAQDLIAQFAEKNSEAMKQMKEQSEATLTETVNSLKKEWGQAFEHKVKAAQRAVEEIGGKDLVEALNKTGAGNDPNIIRAFAKMADFLREDVVVGANGSVSAMTPNEAVEKARSMMSDPAHPFNNKAHPNHQAAKKEVERLYQIAYPE